MQRGLLNASYFDSLLLSLTGFGKNSKGRKNTDAQLKTSKGLKCIPNEQTDAAAMESSIYEQHSSSNSGIWKSLENCLDLEVR